MRTRNKNKRVLTLMSKDGKHFEHYNAVKAVPTDMLATSVVTAAENAKPNALMTPVADFRSPVSAASFDILITRATANIAAYLPIPLFGVLDQESDWVEIMSSFLTTGTTYTVSRNADRKSLDFTFTNGGNTDIVTVSCEQVPYVNLLISGLDSVFKMQQNKMQISDVAEQAQFSKKVGIYDRSFFGHEQKDSITPNQYKSDLQNQNDIRTINQILDIDKQRTLLFQIAPAENFTITISSFIMKYDKGVSAVGF